MTQSTRTSRLLGLVCGNLMGGLSYNWWVAKHNLHHAHPNDLDTDPDVYAGALVFDSGQADQRRGLPAWVTRHQAGLFFPMLLSRHSTCTSPASARCSSRALVTGLPRRCCWWSTSWRTSPCWSTTLTWPQALAFVGIHKGLQGIYLGMSFAPGHKGMPVMDEEQSADPFLRQVLTSRNMKGSRFVDTAIGGLNYQIEHHLFPSMPRPNLRLASPVVREFCARRDVVYAEASRSRRTPLG